MNGERSIMVDGVQYRIASTGQQSEGVHATEPGQPLGPFNPRWEGVDVTGPDGAPPCDLHQLPFGWEQWDDEKLAGEVRMNLD